MKKDIVLLVVSGLALLGSLLGVPLLAWVAILLCGIPIVWEAVEGLVKEHDVTADVLVAMALVASVCIGEYFAAGEVAFIMKVGELLEEMTVAKARSGIEKLVHLTPQKARLVQGEEVRIIPAEQVQVGDLLRILPGDTIPVDGVIVSGETSLNQAAMTGESLPVEKTVGDAVSSGTMNLTAPVTMRATKVGEDSSVQRMIRMVQAADADKAKIVRLADRWAVWVVGISLTISILTWILTGEIIRAVTVLVVFCPCALVLATPTAIMAAIGNATKHGFLVREGDALERLAKVRVMAFDKTGTLTYGTPDRVASNTIRPESAGMIARLSDLNITTVLLSGDHPEAAQRVAEAVHIDTVHAECLPEDKLRYIEAFEREGKPVCMIGDGINDAPALKKAMVGIAMGGMGSDIAVEAADIVLVDDEVKELPHLLALSRRMMTTIQCNLTFSMVLNFAAVALAVTGILNPVVGALVHNAGSVLVIGNSALLLKWRKKLPSQPR